MINSDITAERLQEIFESVESGIALCSSTKGNTARNLFYDWRARKFIVERRDEATGETSTARVDTIAEAADAYNGTGAHTPAVSFLAYSCAKDADNDLPVRNPNEYDAACEFFRANPHRRVCNVRNGTTGAITGYHKRGGKVIADTPDISIPAMKIGPRNV